jgi:hypothetical protein
MSADLENVVKVSELYRPTALPKPRSRYILMVIEGVFVKDLPLEEVVHTA